jgi:hypothetical protein
MVVEASFHFCGRVTWSNCWQQRRTPLTGPNGVGGHPACGTRPWLLQHSPLVVFQLHNHTSSALVVAPGKLLTRPQPQPPCNVKTKPPTSVRYFSSYDPIACTWPCPSFSLRLDDVPGIPHCHPATTHPSAWYLLSPPNLNHATYNSYHTLDSSLKPLYHPATLLEAVQSVESLPRSIGCVIVSASSDPEPVIQSPQPIPTTTRA